MKMKQWSKRAAAWLLAMSMCVTSLGVSGEAVQAAADTNNKGSSVTLSGPVVDAEKGKIVWDCVYFGNYWQGKYIPQPENQPAQGEDDVVHEDSDGTKYLVREDKTCYKYEPIKWRVLSVSEDGKDAFLMADKNLDAQHYHTSYSDTVTWENASVRAWLNEDFLDQAFTDGEKAGIIRTEIANKKSPEYVKEENEEDEAPTTDYIYLLSREEVTSRAYGFADNTDPTETRKAENTDFAGSGGTIKTDNPSANYWLRTMGTKGRVSHVDYLEGKIPTENLNALLGAVNDVSRIRPALHVDLTKTGLWSYAGKVKQDKTEIAPSVPTQKPEPEPGVTMAPGQVYPKNPVVNGNDMKKNTWDCIYFGKYYSTKITPSALAAADEHDSVKEDEKKESYLVRHEQGYFQYEPIKWRILSVSADGSDAFVIADKVIDVASYYHDNGVEITWEKSDIRTWLNEAFWGMAFTAEEQEAVKTTDVATADNQWSGESGGNDTKDKIYLPSLEEMLNTAYGFSNDVAEGNTRKITVTDYAGKGGTPFKPADGFMSYWLRSPGTAKGCPAQVGHWGKGEILTEPSMMLEKAASYLGVRPVMHVDLRNTALWTYAGQVTPEGIVIPKKEDSDAVQQPAKPAPDTNIKPGTSTQKPDTEIKKPGKPKIKKLTNKKGKKVTVTLSGKVSGATGYQVAYATKSSMKGQKKKTFKGTSVTVKGLKKKKTYYFRVRAYTKKNGKTVYGDWGNKKRIKIKK